MNRAGSLSSLTLKNGVYVVVNIGRHFIGRQVVGIAAEGILYFLGDEFQTGQHIKNEDDDGNGEVAKGKHEAEGQGHDVPENKFLDEDAVGKRDGRILDPLAGTADIGKGLQFPIEDDEFGFGEAALPVQGQESLMHTGRYLVGYMLLFV